MNKKVMNNVTRVCFFCTVLVVFSAPARAETGTAPTLGGHRFIPSSLVSDAFVSTYFGNSIGIATASDVITPILVFEGPPPDTLLSLTGSLLFVIAEFEYQQAVNPRVALRLSANGGSRVGTSGQSIVSQGVTALLHAGVGTTVMLWQNDNVLLSGVADLSFSHGLAINLIQFAEDVIAGDIENASLLTTEDIIAVEGGVRAAWAAKPWMGFNGAAVLGHTNADNDQTDLLWRLAGSASVDFGQRGGAPIGLLLSLDLDKLQQRTVNIDNVATIVGFGTYYTGREDFTIGLEGSWGHMTLRDSDVVINPVNWQMTLRYYF